MVYVTVATCALLTAWVTASCKIKKYQGSTVATIMPISFMVMVAPEPLVKVRVRIH